MKHKSRSGALVLKQLAVLSIMSLELLIYVTSVDRTRDLASTDVDEVTVWNAK